MAQVTQVKLKGVARERRSVAWSRIACRVINQVGESPKAGAVEMNVWLACVRTCTGDVLLLPFSILAPQAAAASH